MKYTLVATWFFLFGLQAVYFNSWGVITKILYFAVMLAISGHLLFDHRLDREKKD